MEGIEPVADADTGQRPAVGRKFLLERCYFRAANVPAGQGYARNRRMQLLLQLAKGGAKIKEIYQEFQLRTSARKAS